MWTNSIPQQSSALNWHKPGNSLCVCVCLFSTEPQTDDQIHLQTELTTSSEWVHLQERGGGNYNTADAPHTEGESDQNQNWK